MKNFNWKNLLRYHPLFGNLNEKEIEQFLADEVSEERTPSPGSMIMKEGEFGDSIFLIGSGSVQVVLQREGGHEIALALLRQGELFGEMALFQQRARNATVIAKEQCSLLEVKGEGFLRLMSEHPEIEFKVLLTLTERLRRMNGQVLEVQLKDVDEKFSLFNAKLDAQLKVFDASLKAAQAIFEQTKVRTDEVITSAERRQANQDRTMRFFTAVVSLVVVVAGYFGFSKYEDLSKALEDTKQIEERVKQNADLTNGLVKEMEGQVEKVREQEKNLELIPKINTALVKTTQDTIFPIFSQALADGNLPPAKIIALYELLLTLRQDDSKITWRLLGEVERGMVKARDLGVYKELLAKSIQSAQTPREEIIAYYLLLAVLILDLDDEKGNFEKTLSFENTFSEFQKYVGEYKGQCTKKRQNCHIKKLDFSMLEDLFERQHQKKRDLFQQVKGYIP